MAALGEVHTDEQEAVFMREFLRTFWGEVALRCSTEESQLAALEAGRSAGRRWGGDAR